MKIQRQENIDHGMTFDVQFSAQEVKDILFAAAFRAVSGERIEGSTLVNHPLFALMNDVQTIGDYKADDSGGVIVSGKVTVTPLIAKGDAE